MEEIGLNSQQNNVWRLLDLSSNSVAVNSICRIAIENTSLDTEYSAGVRQVGSLLERRLTLSPKRVIAMVVNADKDSTIEVYAEDAAKIKFTYCGCLTYTA